MANSFPYGRHQAIDQSFLLLCDYLNFGDDFDDGPPGRVRFVLSGPYIRPFFEEYARDYLAQAAEIEHVELHALDSWCQKKQAFQLKRCTSSRIRRRDKAGWAPVDHVARFVVQVLRYSWKHEGAWDYGEWDPDSDESSVEFWQAWLILRYLQAEWEAANLRDWDERSVNGMFRQLRLTKI